MSCGGGAAAEEDDDTAPRHQRQARAQVIISSVYGCTAAYPLRFEGLSKRYDYPAAGSIQPGWTDSVGVYATAGQ